MAKSEESAEQKLLKMIESTSGEGAAKTKKTQQKVVSKQNFLGAIKTVNMVLKVGVAVAVIFLGYEIFSGVELMAKDMKISEETVARPEMPAEPERIPESPDVSFYLASVDRRNLFQPYQEAAKTGLVEAGSMDSEIVRRTNHLRLVGIAWLDSVDSASVMIEDTGKNVTYFLQRGEALNDITVKTIYADGVELGYENEEIIIRYDKSQM